MELKNLRDALQILCALTVDAGPAGEPILWNTIGHIQKQGAAEADYIRMNNHLPDFMVEAILL